MSLENKNETSENPVLERTNEQTLNKEVVEDASKFLEGIKTDSILALAEFSKQIERDREIINEDTEHGKEAMSKLDEIQREKKQIEEDLVNDIILWHGSGFSTITLENLSIGRTSEEMKKFLKYNDKASADPRYFGFYTTDSLKKLGYDAGSSMYEIEEREKLEKECEDNKVFDIENQANALYYYMTTKKVSYKEAISIYGQEIGEPINQLFNEKEYTMNELSNIAVENRFDFDSLLKKRLEKYKPTAYKLTIDKNAKIGDIGKVLGSEHIIQKITEEDFKKARELGYDILSKSSGGTGGTEYAILNKDVVKKIDKSNKIKVTGVDENTGKETIKYIYPEFEDEK